MSSTSTGHCSNLKIRFEELNIIFLVREFTHPTNVFLCISYNTKENELKKWYIDIVNGPAHVRYPFDLF